MARAFRTKFDRAVDKKDRQLREKNNGMASSREDLEHEETIAAYERAEREAAQKSKTPQLQSRLAALVAEAKKRTDNAATANRRIATSLSVNRTTLDALDMIGMELGLNRGRTLDLLVAEYIGASTASEEDEDDLDV